MDWIDWPLRQLQSIESMPDWLRASLPMDWLIVKVIIACFLAYLVSVFVKRIVRFIGMRRTKMTYVDYAGSTWDLLDSLAQAVALVVAGLALMNFAGIDTTPWIKTYGGGITTAAIVLVVAGFIARWISGSIRKFGQKARASHHADGTLFAFVGALVTYVIMGFALVFALTQLGVQTASLIALVGAAGLAIALALQDTLKAVASGVMLAIFRPYRIGDWVNVAGMEGEVTDITPFRTTIKPPTNQAVSLPNDKVWTDAISNSTRFARRRLDLYLDISYEDDVERALEVTREAANSLPRALAKSETWVGVTALKDWSVQIRCRIWCATPEYVQVRSDALIAIKKAYAAHGITIPYPHQVEIHRDFGPDSELQPEDED